MSETPISATQMANQAKDRFQTMWTTLKSMTMDEDAEGGTAFKLKPASMEPLSGWESMVRTMFGSCTTGMPSATDESPSSSSRSSKSKSQCEACDPVSPAREKEEFFYAQFMATNNMQRRAEKAVSSLRSIKDQSPSIRQRSAPSPKPFPMSTPPRKEVNPPVLVHHLGPSPKQTVSQNATMSFDDGISAISAHTLEELARHEEAFGDKRIAPGLSADLEDDSLFAPSFSPVRFGRERSPHNGGINVSRSSSNPDISRTSSLRSKKSTQTKSTKSSSEFENVWRMDEKKYWQGIVENDDEINRGRPRTPDKRQEVMLKRVALLKQRSLGQSQHLKLSATATTASTLSASPYSKHPHETFPFASNALMNRTFDDTDDMEEEIITTQFVKHNGCDPDRLQEILILNHETELGEI